MVTPLRFPFHQGDRCHFHRNHHISAGHLDALNKVMPEQLRIGEMAKPIQVLTTTETKDDAQAIADALVERRLAGCVQVIGPVTSTYRWQGEIETARE